jgi:hypothetical protein
VTFWAVTTILVLLQNNVSKTRLHLSPETIAYSAASKQRFGDYTPSPSWDNSLLSCFKTTFRRLSPSWDNSLLSWIQSSEPIVISGHQYRVRVRVTLRLIVSQSVSQYSWCRAHFVDVWPDIASFSRVWIWNLLSCLCGAPSLARGRVCPL